MQQQIKCRTVEQREMWRKEAVPYSDLQNRQVELFLTLLQQEMHPWMPKISCPDLRSNDELPRQTAGHCILGG